ncbi:hypothetical protein ACIA8G_35540 [Lentzea sp. NPDC051213]|uniref:hypothetical protein n=1 Tax=Lentzea sp. NPDC051213 TaxID=3364126 RepID=UPI0037B0E887
MYGGLVVMTAKAQMGLDLNGFFVLVDSGEVFCSTRFRQGVAEGKVTFTDGPHSVTLPIHPIGSASRSLAVRTPAAEP